MAWFVAAVGLLPGLFLIRLMRRGWSKSDAAAICLVTVTAVFVASPFLTQRSLGTGEYYNYSLAVADTVTQVREGVFPVFVGQSEFAFHGRVHPLRTAVYFTHAAAILDLVTFHQLSFWAIQNLSIALSLVASAFSMFAVLRRVGRTPPWVAAALACAYVLSPGLLAPAYSMDLYMTVTAAPFLPLAVAGALGSWSTRGMRDYALMAVGLAGAWLAHPPVAAWTTLGCAIVVAGSWLSQRPRWSALAAVSAAAMLGLLLAGWSFASALSLPDNQVEAGPRSLMAKAITSVTTSSGWAALAPVSRDATQLGDFQLGYPAFILLAITGWVALRRRRLDLGAVVAAVALFLVLTLPVPILHRRAWEIMPATFGMLTNVWPMQRSYLVMAAFVALGFGAAWPWLVVESERWRRRSLALGVSACLLLSWTVWQAWPFVARGLGTRVSAQESGRNYLSTNLAQSIVTYAFTGTPDNFYNGSRDPEQELRLLAVDGRTELRSNARVGQAATLATTGRFRTRQAPGATSVELEPKLVLLPGRKYRLTFEFLTPPIEAVLHLLGDATVSRDYLLPHSQGSRGFGMAAGNSHAIALWSNAAKPETVTLSLHFGRPDRNWSEFAAFRLEEIATDRLPLRLERLAPTLRCSVDAPQPGWLETPRMFVAGYEATVDGQRVYPRKGHDGVVLVPVPAGRHAVELSYRAPFMLRAAATVSLATWAAMLVVLVLPASVLERLRVAAERARLPRLLGLGLPVAVVCGALTALPWWWPIYKIGVPRSPGPLRLRVALPIDAQGKLEPLASAGIGVGSTTVFLQYYSSDAIRLGIEVFGEQTRTSELLPVDYRLPVEITITSGIFYQSAEERLRAQSGTRTDWLLTHTQVLLNGRPVVHTIGTHRPARNSRVNIAPRVTTGTSYLRKFGGEIIERSWLPVETLTIPFPSEVQLEREVGPLRISARLPKDRPGQCEPLATFGRGDNASCVFVHYLDSGHVRVGFESRATGLMFAEPLAFDYDHPLELTVSHATLYPPGARLLRDYSPLQASNLRGRTRLAIGDRWILSAPLKGAVPHEAGIVAFERNTNGAGYPSLSFNGEIIRVQRVAPAGWPVPPGAPEAATAPGAAGPLEITALLPRGMTGRSQPLLTIGQPGKGSFVIVRYVDAEHIQLGMDVWNKALLWSQPFAVDFSKPHQFLISISALYPTDADAVRALPTERANRLRNEIRLSVDGAEVLRETMFTYDSAPADLTPGASKIGGSYTEATFAGEILQLRRLPVPVP